MIDIVVVDRDPLSRLGMATIIQNKFKVFNFSCFSTLTALFEKNELRPHLLIWGISTHHEEENPMKVISSLKKTCPEVKVMMYDRTPDFCSSLTYLRGGVDGYVNIRDELKEISNCINALLNGRRYVTNEAGIALLNQITNRRLKIIDSLGLSARERLVANYLVSGRKVCEIARLMDRSPSTISTCKRIIFAKLKVKNLIQLNSRLSDSIGY